MLLISVDKHFTLIIMIPGLQHTSWGFSSWEAYNWSSNGILVMAATSTESVHSREENWIVFENMKYTNKLTFMKNRVFRVTLSVLFSIKYIFFSHCHVSVLVAYWSQFSFPFPFLKTVHYFLMHPLVSPIVPQTNIMWWEEEYAGSSGD